MPIEEGFPEHLHTYCLGGNHADGNGDNYPSGVHTCIYTDNRATGSQVLDKSQLEERSGAERGHRDLGTDAAKKQAPNGETSLPPLPTFVAGP